MTTKHVDQFVHLHSHTHHSILDGHDTVPELVAEVARLGQPAVAITDHGSLSGLYELYTNAKDKGVNPIAGIEAYMTPSTGTRFSREPLYLADGGRGDVAGRGAYTHLTILAVNNVGLKNLFQLSLYASTEGFYQKPRVDFALLEKFKEGLIVTTSCPSGEVQVWLRNGRYDKAREYTARLIDLFGKENVFVEIMDHGMKQDLERSVRDDLLRLSKDLAIGLLATNDLHYATKEDAKSHEEMLAIQTRGSMLEPADYDGGKRFAFEGGSYYVKSAAEMAQVFPDHPAALKNTLLIAERASFSVAFDESLKPQVPLPDGYDEDSFLRKEAFEGLARRLPDKANDPIYIARLNTELKVLKDKGFPGYFLVVSDFIRWAKFTAQPKIPMGPGRGSGAGSLTAYCVDITDADPIRFDLLFERFLNPEREAYPDFDVDVDSSDRERLIEYVKDKYGNENVALVTTFGRIGAKNGLKDVARIYEKPFEVGNLLTKALPPAVFGVEIKLSEVYNPEASRYDEASEFRDLVEKENLQDVVGPAQHLEGRIRSLGVHAAAVIISSKPIIDTIPVYMRQVDGAMITSWDYPTAEGIGLLKMDFLGLRNLGVIRDAVENVKRTRGIDINVTELSQGLMDDEKTYEMLQRGDSLGVFQLDGGGMRGLLKSLKPTEFEDISALLSLYRPGPMGVNAHTDFALRKNGLQEVIPIHPEFKESLDEILSPTYQLCVAGDTMIWDATKGTLVRIDSIEEEVKQGSFHTFSVNEEGTPEAKKVTHWFNTGVKSIYEIMSGDGRTLRVSGDHPVLTLDGYKPASELVSEVDFVASSGQSLPVQQSNDFSIDEARLAGYMVGDGYINLYQNTFTNSSTEILDHVKGLAEKLFEDVHCYSIPRFRNGIHYTNHMQFAANPQGTGKGYGVKGVYDTTFKLNRWFKDVLGYTSKTLSRDKFVPEVVFSASEEAIKNFIAGLWDTDGHVNSRFAFFKTISKTLATDLQFLFDRIGIHSYLRPEKTSYISAKYGDTVPYGLYVYDTRFWNEIVPLLVNKNKASSVKVSSQLSAVDCGVSQLMMKDDMYKVIVEDKALSKNLTSRLKNSGTVSLDSIHAYYARNDLPRASTRTQTLSTSTMVRMGVNTKTYIDNFSGPENLFNSKQRWSKINAITVVQAEPVYDITVEDNHNFYANGILVHNCIYQEQIQRIAQVVAGYSLGQADTLRRAMGKKKRYIIDAEFIPFSEGAYARGYSKEAVQALWDILVPFADYAFNKCLSGDTKVYPNTKSYLNAPKATPNSYTLREIAELGLNDDDNVKILAYDEASGTFIWDRVLAIHSNGEKKVYELKLKDSQHSVKSTLDHRHLTNRGWLTLHDIREAFRTEVDSELRILISPMISALGLSGITARTVKAMHAEVESVEYVGVEATYDLEMSAVDHNFVANGIVTHNSHTVAYGITSYITAYLKANYMSEYMAALLSSVSDKTDKTAEYLEDCRAHGIKVNTPDVNQSFVDYAPLSDKEISFGFKAVKGVGEKVADQIVAWRAEHGTFVSVSDFFLRAPKDATNKRVIEALALGGGFDSLDKTRRAIAESLPETLKVLAKIRKSEAKVKLAPTSLFDMFDDMELSASDEEAIKKNSDSIFIPELVEYPELEKLKLERQVLGLYVSGHPLAGLDLSGMFSVKIGDLVSTGEGDEPVIPPLEGWAPRDAKGHKIAGIITSLQLKRTKKGDSMAVGVVEDMGASIPFTMFPKVFESFGEYLKLDGVYQLTGFSRRREGEEEISFNVDMVRPLEFSDAGKLSVRVKVTEQQWLKGKDVFLQRLEKHRMKGFGTTNIVVSIKHGDGEITEETVDFTVRTSPVLTSEIRELFGMLAIGRWRKPN